MGCLPVDSLHDIRCGFMRAQDLHRLSYRDEFRRLYIYPLEASIAKQEDHFKNLR
jgi:hypothetical protein